MSASPPTVPMIRCSTPAKADLSLTATRNRPQVSEKSSARGSPASVTSALGAIFASAAMRPPRERSVALVTFPAPTRSRTTATTAGSAIAGAGPPHPLTASRTEPPKSGSVAPMRASKSPSVGAVHFLISPRPTIPIDGVGLICVLNSLLSL